jgi:RimJ/RimL family protein N-acetyltransferase
MKLDFIKVNNEADNEVMIQFLCTHEWPFHSFPHISLDQAKKMVEHTPESSAIYWILSDSVKIGLLRVLDLDDIEDGSPVFDLRIAPQWRNRGFGKETVSWMSRSLFEEYPELHRIEATTRIDNIAMRRVLEYCDFELEGLLRETWPSQGGVRFDTAIYGLLRSDWLHLANNLHTNREVFMADPTTNQNQDNESLVKHNNASIEIDDDTDIALTVRHNRPAPDMDDDSSDTDIALTVRHNRPAPDMDDDTNITLEVRHNRPFQVTEDDSSDTDIALTVRHNRPAPDVDDDTNITLEVRHNRPFQVTEDDSSDTDIALTVRHNRPAPDAG